MDVIHDSLEEFISKLNVLYVEDNEEARIFMHELLDNFFDNIILAKNGEEGIKKFKKNKIDLVISDIRMPKMNGVEMAKEIKAINKNIPIIIITAYQESTYLLDCIQYSIDAYILKPVDAVKLKEVIYNIANKIYCDVAKKEYETHLEKMVEERTKELERAYDQLIDMVNHDSMTGLYNRRYFNEITNTLINITKRNGSSLSIMMIDIDNFKMINDRFGHIQGDKVIQAIAKLLLKMTRKSDIVVRFGGEEFIVLLPNTSIDGAYKIAQKIKDKVNNIAIPLANGDSIKFTVSIGVSTCNNECSMNMEELVHKADVAMYDAKLSGRNKIVMYQNRA